MGTEKKDGLSLKIFVRTFNDMKYWVDRFLGAGILRCISPERTKLCDNPATRIFWQDQAEWYPCCDKHFPGGDQWCGGTEFSMHLMDLPVIPDKALEWLNNPEALLLEDRKRIKIEKYEREE